MELEKETPGTVRERLQAFVKSRGITDAEFCRRVGVSPAYVTSMRKSVSPAVMNKISKVFPMLNPQWLLAGTGDMLLYSDKYTAPPPPGGMLPSEMLSELLKETRNEKARLLAMNEKLTEVVQSQQETIAELTREMKKVNARTVEDATCAAAG